MIDHRIILSILYRTTHETPVERYENKKAYASTTSFIFFPFLKKGYYEKLIRLDTRTVFAKVKHIMSCLGKNELINFNDSTFATIDVLFLVLLRITMSG